MVAMIKHGDYDAVLIRECWWRTASLVNTRQLKAIIKFEIIAHANWNHDINWIVPDALTHRFFSSSSSPFSRAFLICKPHMNSINPLLQNNNHRIHVWFVEKWQTNWLWLLEICWFIEQKYRAFFRNVIKLSWILLELSLSSVGQNWNSSMR